MQLYTKALSRGDASVNNRYWLQTSQCYLTTAGPATPVATSAVTIMVNQELQSKAVRRLLFPIVSTNKLPM